MVPGDRHQSDQHLPAGARGGGDAARSPGAVVTIASTRAHMSEPHTEAYSASKGGLVALTHALAISLGPEVRVNCISPGWILTKGAGAADRPTTPSTRPVGSACQTISPHWRHGWSARKAGS